jgi:hypothetical protein
MVVRVQASRVSLQDPIGTNGDSLTREVMRFLHLQETLGDPMLPRKAAYRATFVIVLQTDSGGREEYSKARERTLVKELGKMTP